MARFAVDVLVGGLPLRRFRGEHGQFILSSHGVKYEVRVRKFGWQETPAVVEVFVDGHTVLCGPSHTKPLHRELIIPGFERRRLVEPQGCSSNDEDWSMGPMCRAFEYTEFVFSFPELHDGRTDPELGSIRVEIFEPIPIEMRSSQPHPGGAYRGDVLQPRQAKKVLNACEYLTTREGECRRTTFVPFRSSTGAHTVLSKGEHVCSLILRYYRDLSIASGGSVASSSILSGHGTRLGGDSYANNGQEDHPLLTRWLCPSCNEVNSGRRSACSHCSSSRLESSAPTNGNDLDSGMEEQCDGSRIDQLRRAAQQRRGHCGELGSAGSASHSAAAPVCTQGGHQCATSAAPPFSPYAISVAPGAPAPVLESATRVNMDEELARQLENSCDDDAPLRHALRRSSLEAHPAAGGARLEEPVGAPLCTSPAQAVEIGGGVEAANRESLVGAAMEQSGPGQGSDTFVLDGPSARNGQLSDPSPHCPHTPLPRSIQLQPEARPSDHAAPSQEGAAAPEDSAALAPAPQQQALSLRTLLEAPPRHPPPLPPLPVDSVPAEFSMRLEVGDEVYAEWHRNWHPGVLKEFLPDGRVEIWWESDPPTRDWLPRSHVRRRQLGKWLVGDNVLARCPGWGDELFPGRIWDRLHDGHVKVLWDEDGLLSMVPQDWVRLPP